MPELNIVRSNASACSLGGNIYVIGGSHMRRRALNSIEKLINPGHRDKAFWQLIETPYSILIPRCCHFAVPLNSKEIVIFGGF